MRKERDEYPEMVIYREAKALQQEFNLSNETLHVFATVYNLTSKGTTPGLKHGITVKAFKQILDQHRKVFKSTLSLRNFENDIVPHFDILVQHGLLIRLQDVPHPRNAHAKPARDYYVTDLALEIIKKNEDTYIEVDTNLTALF